MGEFSIHEFTSVDKSGIANGRAWRHYYYRSKLLSTSMFEWLNLPNEIDAEFIEKNLYEQGKLSFFYDDDYGFIITKCTDTGDINIYDRPVSYECYGNKFNKKIAAADCVIIRNNILELPTWTLDRFFLNRLWDIQRSIDVNLHNSKTPNLVQCAESQRLTLKNLFMQYDGNIPAIFANKDIDLDGVKVLNFNTPFIADKLWEIKDKLWNEFLSTKGINNANTEKRERLITDEVNANNQLIDFQVDTLLNSRKKAVELINKKWNLNIEVKLRENKEEQEVVKNE